MAYEQYSVLKQMVANRLGKTNDATAETLRDNAIVDACRQIYRDGRFSWMLKRTTTISLSAGVANLPSDFSADHGFKTLYEPVSGIGNDRRYTRVAPEELDNYTTSDYVYCVLWDSTNKIFTLLTNQTASATLTGWYYAEPTALSASSDTTPIPDAWAIVNLATAIWWLGSERDEDNYDRFYRRYTERLEQMKANDRSHSSGRREMSTKISTTDTPSTLMTRR